MLHPVEPQRIEARVEMSATVVMPELSTYVVREQDRIRTSYVVKSWTLPPSKRFSTDQMKAAALGLVDEKGLAALTMRNLADALGTGAMTIYNYVDGREGLEALLIDAVMSQVSLPRPSSDWRQDVRHIATAVWRTVRLHPQVIPLILSRRTMDEATLDYAEALLDALARSGRSGPDLHAAFRVVSGFVAGFAQAELADPTVGAGPAAADKTVQRALSLPYERYPRLLEIAKAASRSSPKAAFAAGLDIVLAGLA